MPIDSGSRPADTGDQERHPGRSGEALPRMVVAAAASGVITGGIGSAFHLSLAQADTLRAALLGWARQWPAFGWLVPVLFVAVVAAAVQWMVRRFAPQAAGSGVPHVEAASSGALTPLPLAVLPVSFIGGVLAIGSGLAVGREGTIGTVGSAVGAQFASRFRIDTHGQQIVRSASFGAGLGVAFNAPLGGLAFVFEGLTRRISTEIIVTSLVACATAVSVMHVIMGNGVEFLVSPLPSPTVPTIVVCLGIGAIIGCLAVTYNRAIIFWLDGQTPFHRLPGLVQASLVGAVVGLVAWLEPLVVGDGHQLVQETLDGRLSISLLLLAAIARWFLGPFSHAAGVPGGLFAPAMVAGAVVGAFVAEVVNRWLPALALDPAICAIAGMAAFIAAAVRVPLTGIALVLGVTGTVAPVIPMLAACSSAIIMPILLKDAPIFTALREKVPASALPGSRLAAISHSDG